MHLNILEGENNLKLVTWQKKKKPLWNNNNCNRNSNNSNRNNNNVPTKNEGRMYE